MIVTRTKPTFKDARGVITDILERTDVDSITILTSKKGAVRGNHYHKKTTQYTYVLEGKFRLYTQDEGENVKQKIIKKGDLVTSPPLERHAFVAMEDSLILAICKGPRAGENYEDDTFHLEKPISGSSTKR